MLNAMRPVLLALEKVHRTGIVHRDISPDNIMIRKDGSLVLIDFGAARMRNIDNTKTMTVLFKRGFSPEEQYRYKGRWGSVYRCLFNQCDHVLYVDGRSTHRFGNSGIGRRYAVTFEYERAGNFYQAKEGGYERNGSKCQKPLAEYPGIVRCHVRRREEHHKWFRKTKRDCGNCGCGCAWNRHYHRMSACRNQRRKTGAGHCRRDTGRNTGSHENTEKGNFDDQCDRKNDGGGRKEWGSIVDITWKQEYSDTAKKGMVISQNVSAGEWVSADQKLVLTISKGQGKTVVPKLLGLTLEQAKKKLKKAHLTYKIQREESNKAVDTVLSQSVAKGKKGGAWNGGKTDSEQTEKSGGCGDEKSPRLR